MISCICIWFWSCCGVGSCWSIFVRSGILVSWKWVRFCVVLCWLWVLCMRRWVWCIVILSWRIFCMLMICLGFWWRLLILGLCGCGCRVLGCLCRCFVLCCSMLFWSCWCSRVMMSFVIFGVWVLFCIWCCWGRFFFRGFLVRVGRVRLLRLCVKFVKGVFFLMGRFGRVYLRKLRSWFEGFWLWILLSGWSLRDCGIVCGCKMVVCVFCFCFGCLMCLSFLGL